MNYYLKSKYDLYEAKSNGSMVSLIKELREFTGYPLKEAKKIFDEICFHGYFEISEDEYNRLLYQYDRYKYSQSPSFYVEKYEKEDDVRIYNRVLSQTEIEEIYKQKSSIDKKDSLYDYVKEMLVSAVYELVREDQFEKAIQILELLQNFKEGK